VAISGDLALAYCISIHKSQGSEYPVVDRGAAQGALRSCCSGISSTPAITRGRKKVFLVGEPAAYAMAVRNSEAKVRCNAPATESAPPRHRHPLSRNVCPPRPAAIRPIAVRLRTLFVVTSVGPKSRDFQTVGPDLASGPRSPRQETNGLPASGSPTKVQNHGRLV